MIHPILKSYVNHGRASLLFGTFLSGAGAILLPTAASSMTLPPIQPASAAYRFQVPVLNHDVAAATPVAAPRDLTQVRSPTVRLTTAASPADVTVNAGDVTTTGDDMPAVSTRSSGNTSITGGTIVTAGTNSDGIDAQGAGNIGIGVSSVSTSGDYSSGISARSDTGIVQISEGSVSTQGKEADGIYASGHQVSINAGDVTTSGNGSAAISAHGVGSGASVDLTVTGTIETYGNKVGIVGAAPQAITVTSDGSANVQVSGNIITYGGGGSGIVVGAHDDVTIVDTGSIETLGNSPLRTPAASPGIRGVSDYGNVTIDAASIETLGSSGTGIYGSARYGHVSITAGDITTGIPAGSSQTTAGTGASPGIIAFGQSVEVTLNGTLTTLGFTSTGIAAEATGGDAVVHNNGTINVVGSGAGQTYGILAEATGNILIDGAGKVNVTAVNSPGIIAVSSGGGNVSISQSSVYGRGGIGAITYTGAYAESPANPGGITISAGTVAGSANGAGGTAIYALDANAGGQTSITVGKASTVGGYADGINVIAISGDAAINAGEIDTQGFAAAGVVVTARSADITVGSLSTAGKGAIGIYAKYYDTTGSGGSIDINATSVSTSGIGADGIVVQPGYAGTKVDVGTLTTTGKYSSGIHVLAVNGGPISITAGTVSTSGDYSTGIYGRTQGGDTQVSVTGSISTTGTHSSGLIIDSYGNADVSFGSISTAGENSTGAVIYAQYGQAHVKGGSITTSGAGADGIFVGSIYGVDVSVDHIATSGDQAAGIIVRDGGTASSDKAIVSVGDITTTGEQGYGAYVATYRRDADISIGSVSTSGKAGAGVVAVTQYSSADLTVGTIKTSGQLAVGAYIKSDYDIIAQIGSVATQGTDASGIVVKAGVLGEGGSLALNVGSVTTSGNFANGIGVYSAADSNELTVGSLSTSGGFADGVFVASHIGTVSLDAQSIATAGDYATGADILSRGGVTLSAGTVSTKGTYASGIEVLGISDIAVTADDVTTGGKGSTGIVAWSGAPADLNLSFAGNDGAATSVAVKAGSVATSGDGATAIWARNDYGAVSVDAGSVSATGAGSAGIVARGTGSVSVTAGTLNAGSDGIMATGTSNGAVTVGVTGKLTAGGDGIFASALGGATSISVGAKGSVAGGLDGIHAVSGTGQVSITNAGTIAGGQGYAIEIDPLPATVGLVASVGRAPVHAAAAAPAAGATIANSGTIVGAVALTSGDDTLTNSGTFVATKDSDFGAGSDLLVNSGTFAVSGAGKPVSVHLLGLEQFQNAGGLVDLRNGVVGDTLTLAGTYVGSNGAKLGLDVGAGGADKLVVTGAATGSTTLLLNAGASSATLLASPVTLVQAGAGTSANAFSLANQDIGLVAYGLSYNAATSSFQLTAQAGAPVFRLARITEGAQSIWHQSADAWDAHMAELRDAPEPQSRVWGQAYGRVDTRDDKRDVAGTTANLGYRQDYYGGQAGIDLAGKRSEDGNGILFGVTGGYLSSHLNFRADATRVRFDTFTAGGYAAWRAGPLFANLLGQYNHYRLHLDNGIDHWSDSLNGSGYGAQAEVGARLGTARLFAEPLATLAWQHTSLGTLQLMGQGVDLGHGTAVTGTLGARFGTSIAMAHGATATLYAKAAYVHEFKGKDTALLESGGTSQEVSDPGIGDHAQAAIGVNILTTGRLSGFIEADANAGGDLKGGGGRAGIRFKL